MRLNRGDVAVLGAGQATELDIGAEASSEADAARDAGSGWGPLWTVARNACFLLEEGAGSAPLAGLSSSDHCSTNKEALGCWAAGLPTGWASSANEKQTPRVEERKKWGPKMPARRQAEFSEYQAVSLGWWQVIQKRQNIKLKKGKLKTINYQKIQCELKNKNTKARGRDTQRTSGRTYRRTVGEVNTAGENETQETTESTRLDKYGLFERLVGRKSPLSEQNMAAQLRKTG